MHARSAATILGLALSVWSLALAAQQPTTPGGVGDTLKKPPILKPITPPPAVEAAPKPSTAPSGGGKAIAVNRFDFTGNFLFKTEDLRALVASYLGRPVTLFDIYEAADQVTSFYVSRGYTLASVNVPAQKIDGGVVRLEVIEGRIGEIQVEGNRRYRTDSVIAYLEGVKPGGVYRGSSLAEGLSNLNELPGLSTRAVLRPGTEFGTSDVVVQATEKAFEGRATVDNYGREDVGEFRFTASGTFNNPLRAEDQLEVLGLITEDHLLKYGYLGYSIPLDVHGTRLSVSYGEAEFEVDGVRGLDGENKSGRIELSRSLIRTRTDRLSLSLGVSSTSADTDLAGVPLSQDTDLTLLEFGGSYLHAWANRAASQLGFGMSSNFDRASNLELNNQENLREDQRFRAQLDVLHLHPLPKQMEALIGLSGAWSPDPLADTQKFSLGGPGSVRGYPASEVRGDYGFLSSLTVRRPFALGPVSMFGSVFVDSGKVASHDTPEPGHLSQTLSSVGLGVEGRYKQFHGKLDWAFPREDSHEVSDSRDDSRVFGAVSVSF